MKETIEILERIKGQYESIGRLLEETTECYRQMLSELKSMQEKLEQTSRKIGQHNRDA